MHLTPSTSPRMAKSTSLGLLDHDGEMHIVDKDDIIGLTQDVKNFSDGLGRLKELFNEEFGGEEDLRVLAHERLGDVLCTLKSVLQRYPPLNTTELFSAAGTLIKNIKGYNYEEHSVEAMEGAFNDAIDQLALEFSSSVSEYLMGDQNSQMDEIKTKSYDNLLSVSQEGSDKDDAIIEKEELIVPLTPEQIDEIMMNLQAGLDLAFQRAKAWSKYLKDVMSYIERRAQLEVEYSKNLSRLASSVKPSLTEEGFLPLQSVYCTVLSQDAEYAKTCQATFTLLQTTKFVEPLSSRRNEHDKTRKTLKETWNKEVKKMQESVNNLRKAQTMYVTRQQEYEKAKELSHKTESDIMSHSNSSSNLSAKIDKKKRAEDDASHKAAEAETTYKACVAEANNRQGDLQKLRAENLAAIRDQIYQSDQVIRKVTIDYFQLLQTVSAPVPVQYHTLCEASKKYEAGFQYGEFVRRLPVSKSNMMEYELFKFEPYNTKADIDNRKVSTQSNESEPSDHHHSGESSPNLNSPRRHDKYRVPVRGAWTPQGMVPGSDTDSQSGSSKSLESSPSNSPFPSSHKKRGLTGSMDDLIEDVPHGVKQLLSVPGTEQVDVQSIVKRQGRRRNTTFGVDFQEQVEHYHSAIPPIISKCLKEVEKRGITVKGIYRVSGVKSTVENLCQRFESDPESVSLDSENPNVISNVLKLYLRQLPEPLLTFKLYPNFVQTAKENMSGALDKEHTIEKLHELIDKLPYSNRKTCGILMHHLQRIAFHVDQNQMNASNLGIVFGPTLLRPQGGNASLACLVDTPHQTRVVELLIVHAESLFGPNEDHQLIPVETLVEPMEKRNALQVPNSSNIDVPSADTAIKVEPKKESVSSPPPVVSAPKEQLITPSPSGNLHEPSPTKKPGEDILLPGSASIDKKDISSSQPNSDELNRQWFSYICDSSDSIWEGEDNEVENGFDHLADTNIHSDDDELLLPDDSHLSKLGHETNRLGRRVGLLRPDQLQFMTPPLTTRRGNHRLKSPASSPNLSVRSAISSPPTIKIEDSLLESPNGSSDNPPSVSLSDNSVPASSPNSSPQKVFQLPPVNTWVPKGESLFTSILDQRSPQVYRRTTVSTTKTASYPPTAQSLSTTQCSRVSWPQESQTPQTADSVSSPRCVSDILPDDSSKSGTVSKSPRLLRKCTSFDLERSKPFPTRSIMTSPLILRKGNSSDESGVVHVETKDFSEWPDVDNTKSGSDRIIHKEEDEMRVSTDALNAPSCQSYVESNLQYSTVDSIAGNGQVKCIQSHDPKLNDSLENSVKIIEPVQMDNALVSSSLVREKESKTEIDLEKGSEIVSSHVASDVSITEKSPTAGNKTELVSKDVSGGKKKVTDAKEITKVRAKTSDKSVKTAKAGQSEKAPKTPASSVKTAFLTSAAKLKSFGRKSPVTLLSYKSKSISIPDQSRKSGRPSSTSEINPDTKGQIRKVHQTESSPTVLVANVDENEENSDEKKVEISMTQSATTLSVKSESPKLKTSSSRAQTSSVTGPKKLLSDKKGVKSLSTSDSKPERKEKSGVGLKTSVDKSVKGSQSKTSTKEKQALIQKTSHTGKALITVAPRAVPESSAMTKVKKTVTKSETPSPKSDKVKTKQTKRGSISSGNSDTTKPTDHFRDCCHGRRRTEKK